MFKFNFLKKTEQPSKPEEGEKKNEPSEEKRDKKQLLIQMGLEQLKNSPFITRDYLKEAGLPEEEIKLRLGEIGAKFIDSKPRFAGDCFLAAGFSKEVVKPLFELAEDLQKEREQKQGQEPEKKERELTPREKLRFKELGLTFVVQNQKDAAKICFRKVEVPEEEIESLLELNLLGVEKEKEKIKEELVKTKEKK